MNTNFQEGWDLRLLEESKTLESEILGQNLMTSFPKPPLLQIGPLCGHTHTPRFKQNKDKVNWAFDSVCRVATLSATLPFEVRMQGNSSKNFFYLSLRIYIWHLLSYN